MTDSHFISLPVTGNNSLGAIQMIWVFSFHLKGRVSLSHKRTSEILKRDAAFVAFVLGWFYKLIDCTVS